MTIEWIIGVFIGLLITVAGFLMKNTLSNVGKRLDAHSKHIGDLKERSAKFITTERCDDRKAANDRKIDELYTHQNSSFELLRRDIKDLGKEIKEDINKHMDDHLQAYHQK